MQFVRMVFSAFVIASVATVFTLWAEAGDELPACPAGAALVTRDEGLAQGCERASVRGTIRVGKWVWKNAKGVVIFEVSFNDLGREHGKALRYSNSGKVVQELEFADGQLEGVEITRWAENGHVRTESTYRGGKLHGLRKRWEFNPKTPGGCKGGPADERCWFGSQDCWFEGERQSAAQCDEVFAKLPETGRSPASGSK